MGYSWISKNAQIFFLKDKKCIEITNIFKKLDESNRSIRSLTLPKWTTYKERQPSKTLVDKLSWLQDDNIKIYSTHNEEKSVVPKTLIRMIRKNLQIYGFHIKKTIYS